MAMKTQKRLVTLITGITLALILSTSVFAGPTGPTKTEYLKTTSAGFSIDRSAGGLYYAMSFQIRKNLKAPLYVSVQYQNPNNSDSPFIRNAKFTPKQKVFRTESPAFKEIKNNHSYLVSIKLYDDKERKNLISKHSQKVYFSVPEKLVSKLGIELIR
jgi:hypothetical protein